MEFVIVGKICRKKIGPCRQVDKLLHARAFTHALQGRLFRLPRGSNPRSIRERVELLKLACLIGAFVDSVL